MTVTTDASEQAVGGVFSEDRHPVTYGSRKRSPAESNYSNVERREALAIAIVVTRLKQFLLGRKFNLQTDQKALQYLFAPDGEIQKRAFARITRWAIALIGLIYKIKYVLGSYMCTL